MPIEDIKEKLKKNDELSLNDNLELQNILNELEIKFLTGDLLYRISIQDESKLKDGEAELIGLAIKNQLDTNSNYYYNPQGRIFTELKDRVLLKIQDQNFSRDSLSPLELIFFNQQVRYDIEQLRENKKLPDNQFYEAAKKLSPFPGKVLYPGTKDTGAQKKAKYTGQYWDEDSKKMMFIKKSEEHPEDDIAEVYGSKLSRVLVDESFASCNFIKTQKTSTNNVDSSSDMYITSVMYDGFKPFFTHRRHNINLFGKKMEIKTADFNTYRPATKIEKKDDTSHRLYKRIDKLEDYQTKELCRVLATSLLYRGYDTQTENINFYKKKNSELEHVGRIDFGWMFNNIASPKKEKVTLIDRVGQIQGKRKSKSRGGLKPTNHFLDYFIFDKVQEAMPDQLEEIASSSIKKMEELMAEMNASFEEIGNCAPTNSHIAKRNHQSQALYGFALHMGMESWEIPELDDLLPLPKDKELRHKIDIRDQVLKANIDQQKLAKIKNTVHLKLQNSIQNRARQLNCIAKCIRYQNDIRFMGYYEKHEHQALFLKELLEDDDFNNLHSTTFTNGDKFVDFNSTPKNIKSSDYPERILNRDFILDVAKNYKKLESEDQEVVVKFIAKFCQDETLLNDIKKKDSTLFNAVKKKQENKKDMSGFFEAPYAKSNNPLFLQNGKNAEKYIALIIDTIKNNNILNQQQYPEHAKIQQIISSYNLDLQSISTKEISDRLISSDKNAFQEALNNYSSNKMLLGRVLKSQNVSSQSNQNTSYQGMLTPPPLGVDSNTQSTNISKDNFGNILTTLANEENSKILRFSDIQKISFSTGESFYESTVTKTNNENTKIRLAENGNTAHMTGTYNEENFKILLDVYIRTKDIRDPNIIKPLNIPETHQDSVENLIHEAVNEYLQEIGQQQILSNESPMNNM